MTSEANLDAAVTAGQLKRAAAALGLSESAYTRALELAGLSPDARGWTRGADRLLMAFGVMAVLAGITAFFAYNWAGLHKFAKFGLIEGGIVAAVGVTAWRGIDSAAGRGALFAAAFLVGILFAIYGQVYQTGADPYGLFMAWAVLIAAWVVIGRQAGLWMLLLVLVDLSVILYWTQVLRPDSLAQLGQLLGPLAGLFGAVTDGGLASLVFILNAGALAVWEWFARRGVPWMQGRWWPRIVAVLTLIVVVTGSLFYIFAIRFGDRDSWLILSGPVFFVAFAAASLWYYQFRQIDLFTLTATLLGGIVVITATLARGMSLNPGSALTLAMLVIVQTAGAAYWIRRVAERSREA